MKRSILTFFCCLTAVAAVPAAPEPDAASAVSAAAPGTVFVQGEALKFRLSSSAVSAGGWVLRNWKDELLRRGDWPQGEERELVLDALPNGYYKLELPGLAGFRSFVVVSDPAGRAPEGELYFAMDSAQSWLARPDAGNPRQPENPYEVVSEVARRAGLQMVRERLNWAEVEAVPGRYDWLQYGTNAKLLSERGVKVLGMYHHAPEWVRRKDGKLPVDLFGTYRFAKKAAETFRGQMTAWEFWNEQDIGFAVEAAWDYAAALKAAYLGFKAADPELPVAIGGYAITPILPYADVVMKNGAGEYFDIFSVHTYRPISEFPAALRSIRSHLERFGAADRPIWFTENGSNMEGAGRADGLLPGLKAHSPEQEMLIAEYLPKMMVIMQFLGVSRDFFFVLPPYNESGGNKDWGLMRRDFSVKPGYAAFATLVDQLGGAVPEGEVRLGEKLRGFLYRRRDGGKTLVCWSRSELDTEKPRPNLTVTGLGEQTFALPPGGNPAGVDLFGTPFAVDPARVVVTRYPQFLTGVDHLKADIPFRFPAAAVRPAETEGIDKTVVFRTELSDDFRLFVGRDCADVKKAGARLRLQVWNLSDRAKRGWVAVSGGACAGLPESVVLPPFGRTELELAFTPELDGEFKGELRADGVFDGRRATPLVIPLQSLAEMNSSGRKVEMPQMLDPENWRRNAAGTMEIRYDENDRAIRFETKFPTGANRWSYPEYTLQLPQESLEGAIGIGFEAKVSKPSAVLQMLLMAVPEKGKDVYLKSDAPGGEFREHFIAFPPGLDAGGIRKLRLGVNALEDEISVSVRNIRIFYGR